MYLVFDTNAARDYVRGLKSQEEIKAHATATAKKLKEKGIKFLVSPIVMTELLYHITDPDDKDYKIARKAIITSFLTYKAQAFFEENTTIPPPDQLIAHDFFGVNNDSIETMFSDILGVCNQIAAVGLNVDPTLDEDILESVKEYVENVEENMVNNIKGHIIPKAKEEAESIGVKFTEYIETEEAAYIFIYIILKPVLEALDAEGKLPEKYKAQSFSNQEEEEEIEWEKEIKKLCKKIIQRYPAYITLFKALITKVHDNGNGNGNGMHEKIKNYIWDLLLLFNPSVTINGEEVLFVTSDKAMLKAAKECTPNVINFNDFESKYLQ